MRPRHAQRGHRLWRVPVAMWLALAVLLAGGGSAYAYFSSTGTGTGHATVGTTVTVTTTASTCSPTLYPGATGTLCFELTNTNGLQVTYTKVKGIMGSQTTVTAGHSGCPYTKLERTPGVTYSVTLTPTIPVTAHNTATGSVSGLVELKSTAPTTCQGATFSVYLVLSGKTS